MSDIEKRARELLAKAYRQTEYPPMVNESRRVMHGRLDRREAASLDAIIAALTPPQSCALAAAARASLPFIAYAFAQGVDGAEEAGRAIEAALQTSVPEGYVLVPVEPTEAMLQEIHLVKSFTGEAMHRRYAAMLAARPEVSGG